MYEDFYNLREKPFNLTPSPRFLYLGEAHKEALALLTYGVMERKGFILLTGEVGTGKTTMVRALLDNLDRSIEYVHLSNPLLSPKDFISYLAITAFKKRVHFKSKAEFLLAFEAFLRRCLRNQENFNLIVDEAHKLSFDLFEEIRLLSNLETGDDKLINIFLVGQPELNEKLNKPEYRPLLQRISVRYQIPPLTQREIGEYISTRLKVAGAREGDQIFSKSAVDTIAEFSKGYPRMINILADNAMLLGYSRGIRKVTYSMVRECFEDLRPKHDFPAKDLPEQQSTDLSEAHSQKISRHWKWATVLIILIILLAVTSRHQSKRVFWDLAAGVESAYHEVSDYFLKLAQPAKNVISQQIKAAPETAQVQDQKDASSQSDKGKTNRLGILDLSPLESSIEKKPETLNSQAKELTKPDGALTAKDDEQSSTIVIVKRGDTLTKLATSVYGRSDRSILNVVKTYNPEIRNMNWIHIGQRIIFPPLDRTIEDSIK